MKNKKRNALWATLSSIILFLAACGQRGQYDAQFAQIDSLADVRPKEADSLLQTLAPAMAKATEADTMCYALLRLKTDDKLYRDITDRRDLAMRLVDYYEHHNKSLLPTALFYAGRVCADLGDAPQALEYYQKTLETLPVDSNTKLHDLIHTQIGYLFNYQGFFDDAINHFQSALHWSELGHDTTAQIFNLRDIGVMYYMKNNIDSSHVYYQKALRLCLLSGKEDMRIGIMSQIARNLNMRQQYGKALEFIRPALVNADSTNISGFYSIASEAYLGVGMIDSARYYADKLCIFGNVYGKRWAYEVLMQVNGQNGNIPSAIDNLNKYKVYDDSVHRLDNAAIVKRMDAMYNYQLHQKEADRLRIDNERKKKIIYMGLAAFLVLALFTTFVILYNRYKRMRIQMWVERLRNQNQQNERTMYSYKRQIEEYHENIRLLDEKRKQLSKELNVLRQEKEAIHSQLEIQYSQKIQEINREKSFLEKQLQETISELEKAESKANIEKEKIILADNTIRNTTIFKQIQSKIQRKDSVSSMPMIKSEWEELEDTVNNIYYDVMKRLTSHVTLNETERRITLLILLELQHKDIAELVCISPSAESVARKRLFKKVTRTNGTAHDWDAFLKEFKSEQE